MMTGTTPIAAGPLIHVHRRCGATIEVVDGWELAVCYPTEPGVGENAIVDMSHQSVHEVSGASTGEVLQSLCGVDVPIRSVHTAEQRQVYRPADTRGLIFGDVTLSGAIDVTGGWSSVALFGPDARTVLNKISGLDLRDETLPPSHCCQGPVFGVNTLFGRLEDQYQLHACPDVLEFLWEVILDAGAEFNLKPARLNWIAD